MDMDATRKGLGRGIASLIPVKRELVTPANADPHETMPYQMVALEDIIPNPNQPRKYFDEKKIDELAASIKEKGVLLPLMVTQKNSKYELVSGERRYRAARIAGIKEVPVLVQELEPKEILELAIIENVQREDLDPIEEAAAYQDLMDQFGYTQEEVAQRVGRDRSTVTNLMRLIKLPLKVKQALQSGQISVGHARALLGVLEIEKQLYFLDRIIEESWSVRELETRVQSRRILGGFRRRSAPPPLSPALVHILDDLRRRLGTQVKLTPSGKKGKIIIEYYSEVDLDRIYQTLIR